MILANALMAGLVFLNPASAAHVPDSGAAGLARGPRLAPPSQGVAQPTGTIVPPAASQPNSGTLSLPPDSMAASAPSDSGAAEPMQEAVKLSTRGAFSQPSARVGDSLAYVVTVEWEDTQVPVMVLAPDSTDFPGFRLLDQATQHKKLANGQSVRNHTEFIYSLRAMMPGPGKAASLKLRYLTGLSQREEAVFVPSALIDIAPAPVRLLDMLAVKIALWLAILGAAVTAGWAAFRLAARKRSEAKPKRADLKPDMDALKARLRTAQNNPESSQAILLEMESLAVRYLQDEMQMTDSSARFETLLKSYLSKGRGGDARPGTGSGEAGDWTKLGELFRHARFAGGYKEPHELQDAFRTFRKCLKMQAEEEL
jgi:hypothetical protein